MSARAMTTVDDVRWQRLQAFDIDCIDDDHVTRHRGALTFVARLARENGWTLAFAQRVFDEYKRFVWLAMVSGHPVTPSEHVDQAWHLHLVYTRSYWDDMCKDILGRPLHHGPTKGGVDEGARFDAQYQATLASYARVFGASPPADIWPAPAQRFGRDLKWRRVWTDDAFIVSKRAVGSLAVVAYALALALASAIAIAWVAS